MATDLALLRLLQLVSPGLPIGMYSYSQGMERAIEDGWIQRPQHVEQWLHGLMRHNISYVDLPVLARFYHAWQQQDRVKIDNWSTQLAAMRETAELRDEDRQAGQALARLLNQLQLAHAAEWQKRSDSSLACLFALASSQWQITLTAALNGYVWSWLENQVLCAVKLVPLGQAAGQQLLLNLAEAIPECVQQALELSDEQLGGSTPAWSLASSRHEMQYSRLFRS